MARCDTRPRRVKPVGGSGISIAVGPSFPPGTFCGRLHTAEKHVGADIECRTVIAPCTIPRLLAGEQSAEMFACGRDDEHTAGARRENVARGINFHPIATAFQAGFLDSLRV